MAKMTAPIQQVSRLLDLVPFLSTHSYISVKELAEEFGVTEREISAELTALSMCGLPGYPFYELIDVSFESGYVTIRNHDALDIPRALSNLEVATLLIGLEIMRDAITEEEKLLTEKIDALISRLTPLVGSAIEIQDHPEALHAATLENVIARRGVVEIVYESALRGEIENRVVEPLSIYRENSHTYLSAFCHKAKGYRNFRMDKISEIRDSILPPLEKEFTNPESERESFQLQINSRRRAVAEFLQGVEIASDGSAAYSAFSREWLAKAVTSFAPDLVLREPAEFRRDIGRRLGDILALYRS
jgi:proteasome accessory factor C